jgi:sensor histidine kinase YesM
MGAVQLLERPTGLGGSGIGMANVAGRLKVLYGDAARMHIDSREGRGTLIRLRLPILQTEGSIPTAVTSYEASTRR